MVLTSFIRTLYTGCFIVKAPPSNHQVDKPLWFLLRIIAYLLNYKSKSMHFRKIWMEFFSICCGSMWLCTTISRYKAVGLWFVELQWKGGLILFNVIWKISNFHNFCWSSSRKSVKTIYQNNECILTTCLKK